MDLGLVRENTPHIYGRCRYDDTSRDAKEWRVPEWALPLKKLA